MSRVAKEVGELKESPKASPLNQKIDFERKEQADEKVEPKSIEEQLVALSRKDSGLRKKMTKKLWLEASRAKSPEVRKKLENGETLSKWMEDHETQACMICDAQFGFFLRKHHCRRCGIIVCDGCSSHKIKFANKMQEKRVCDDCFNGVQKLVDLGIMGSSQAITEEVLEPPSVSIPAWMYAMKPFTQDGYKINIGQLYIRIIEAKDLPAMDFTGFSDPYVVINVGDSEFKTTVMTQTLNPKWASAEFLIPISCATDKIELHVFDQDLHSADDKMGFIEIPLTDLTHQKSVRKWFDLKLEPDVVKELRSKSKDGIFPPPTVLVELQYTFSQAGEFFSYYTPRPAKQVPQPDFQITVTYSTIFRLLGLLGPVFWLLDQITKVIFWTDVLKSAIVLTIFCICTLNPWLYPILFQSLLLYYMGWKYIESKLDSSFLASSSLPGNLRDMEKELKKKLEEDAEGESKKKGEQPIDGVLTGLASKSIIVTGMTETLKWLQNLLVMVCDVLELIGNLFNWSTPVITQSIFIVVLLLDVYSMFFNFKYIAFIAGFYLMTLYTIPGTTIMWLLMSTVGYVSRPRPKFDSSVDFVELEGRQARTSLLPSRTLNNLHAAN